MRDSKSFHGRGQSPLMHRVEARWPGRQLRATPPPLTRQPARQASRPPPMGSQTSSESLSCTPKLVTAQQHPLSLRSPLQQLVSTAHTYEIAITTRNGASIDETAVPSTRGRDRTTRIEATHCGRTGSGRRKQPLPQPHGVIHGRPKTTCELALSIGTRPRSLSATVSSGPGSAPVHSDDLEGLRPAARRTSLNSVLRDLLNAISAINQVRVFHFCFPPAA
ncbi:hypothetical protein GGR57DRAFT_503586 [Xylariaceae sp. FL1272]|nr:hypothetical protein GGR57DRAFT_503586 [Xylariaceae sp. FL1272]